MTLEDQHTDPGYSDYIVFVDESGDHGLGSIDPSYPMFVLERLYKFLEGRGQADRMTHVVVERRGKREDAELELEFRRICDGANFMRKRLNMDIVMSPKESNAPGMQLADLVARPIGLKALRPTQPNRAYDILASKFRRSGTGEIKGWGLKSFP